MRRILYIVRRGKAEILSADKSCVVTTFGPGGYFGEVMMIMFKLLTSMTEVEGIFGYLLGLEKEIGLFLFP